MKSLQNTNGLTSFCIKFIRKKMWVLNLQCKWVYEPMALPEKGVSHRQNFIVYKGIYLQPCDTLIYSKNHLSLTSIVLCSIINTKGPLCFMYYTITGVCVFHCTFAV